MKIDRMMGIVMILLRNKRVSATKLAEMFEVTTRTIYRDIDALSRAGIPVAAVSGINGGIEILESYKVEKDFFTPSDIQTLALGMSSIQNTFLDENTKEVLTKLQSIVPLENIQDIKDKTEQIFIDLSPWRKDADISDYGVSRLKQIKLAIENKQILYFDYADRKKQKTSRKVEPYRLILKGNEWYFQGYCLDKLDFRIFKLNRILNFVLSNDFFDSRAVSLPPINSAPRFYDEEVIVKIKLNAKDWDKVSVFYNIEIVERQENDKIIATFPFQNTEYGYEFIMGFAHLFECLEPESVRDELKRLASEILKIYEKDK